MRRLMFLLPVLLAACAGDPPEPAPLPGAATFDRFCAACHGESARGDGPVAAALGGTVPDLTRIAASRNGKFPRDSLKRLIDGRDMMDAHGSQQMPVWGYEFWIDSQAGDMSDDRVSATLDELVDYLESLQVYD